MLMLAGVVAARLPIVLAPLIAALATAAAAPYLPSASAVTPRVVPDTDPPGANAARTATVGQGIVAGPALGGLLLAVARHLGMGAGGYGYLFASMGVGGLIGTGLAGRAARYPHPRYVLAAALVAVGLPMPLLAVIGWPALAVAVLAFCGAGTMLIEVTMETCLQRTLNEEVFGRAYGLAIPASLGDIVADSLIGPALSRSVGTSGALVIIGCAAIGYAAVVLRKAGGVPAAAPRPVPATMASE